MARIAAVIPAAGQGKRMGGRVNKQFMLLQGMPVIAHTLRVFAAVPEIAAIVLVCAPGEEEYYRQEFLDTYKIDRPVIITSGGRERQDSVYFGLRAAADSCDYVLIHDGARPLVTTDIISRVAHEVQHSTAVVVGVPVKDTIKRTDSSGFVVDTPEREGLWQVQTPQAFQIDLIREAHEKARVDGFCGTDDASLVERLGIPVKIIYGSYENIKLTTPEDVFVAQTLLRRRESR